MLVNFVRQLVGEAIYLVLEVLMFGMGFGGGQVQRKNLLQMVFRNWVSVIPVIKKFLPRNYLYFYTKFSKTYKPTHFQLK